MLGALGGGFDTAGTGDLAARAAAVALALEASGCFVDEEDWVVGTLVLEDSLEERGLVAVLAVVVVLEVDGGAILLGTETEPERDFLTAGPVEVVSDFAGPLVDCLIGTERVVCPAPSFFLALSTGFLAGISFASSFDVSPPFCPLSVVEEAAADAGCVGRLTCSNRPMRLATL